MTDLERFRQVVALLAGVRTVNERIPTEIFVLPRAESDLGVNGTTAGYFLPRLRANYVVMSPQGNLSDEVLKHEYVHFIVHNEPTLGLLPTWFDEGFAELLMTIEVSEDGARLEYGKPNRNRVEWLAMATWIPFRTLLETRDTSDLGREQRLMFYAQAWFLVHYLVLGRSDGPPFATGFASFLRLTRSGAAPVPAFEQAFGLSVSVLERTLRKYYDHATYKRTQLRQPLPAPAATARPVPASEIAVRFGSLSLERGDVDAATRFSAAASAESPPTPQALVVAADLLKIQKRWDEARPLYEQAIAREPDNPYHELDFGEYWLQRAQQASDATQRASWIAEARRHLFRSYQLSPEVPETLQQNGLTYLVPPSDPGKAIESIEAAHALLPSEAFIQASLAEAYVAAGRREDARPILQRLLAWSEDENVAKLKEMLAALDAPPAEPGAGAGDGASAEDAGAKPEAPQSTPLRR